MKKKKPKKTLIFFLNPKLIFPHNESIYIYIEDWRRVNSSGRVLAWQAEDPKLRKKKKKKSTH
jgi:hypothetical protein